MNRGGIETATSHRVRHVTGKSRTVEDGGLGAGQLGRLLSLLQISTILYTVKKKKIFFVSCILDKTIYLDTYLTSLGDHECFRYILPNGKGVRYFAGA